MEELKVYFLDELSRSVPGPRNSSYGVRKFHRLRSGQVHSSTNSSTGEHAGGMHYYMRYMLTFASVFGVFPVLGLHHRNLAKLNFRWFSFVSIYSLCLLAGFLTIEIFALDYTIRNLNEDSLTAKGGIKKATSGSIFYGNACVGMILFIRLARRWPALVRDWQLVETSMSRFGTPRLGWRFTVMSSVLFSLAFVEHGLHNWLNTRPGGKDDISSMSMRGGAKVGANFSIDNSLTFAGYLQRFTFTTF
ncbi:gustatory receptor for sugar taste 64e-like [Diaphorina citri]|uniref:Gustatory receptor for sugar taste 64e-like n=1 Tax=Diaphorina citri TaxID=121845 RepID=A0A3Q0IJ98_DIACI|nr:gustatory receptor for sugar taste 64e-like [Diaphorina citri]